MNRKFLQENHGETRNHLVPRDQEFRQQIIRRALPAMEFDANLQTLFGLALELRLDAVTIVEEIMEGEIHQFVLPKDVV